jgi:hypothetical protein
VKVVVLPQENKVIKLQDLRSSQARSVSAPAVSTPIVVQPKVLKRQQNPQQNIKKKPHVQYRTRDTMPGSTDKIKSIQAIGRDKLLVIVANGPSVTEAPLEKLRNISKIETMSINCPDERLWPTTYWSFFDLSQKRRHKGFLDNYDGYVFNSASINSDKPKSMQFKNKTGQGWSRDPVKNIFIGRSSVYGSMQIAQWMQFVHVYIFGVDMNPDGIGGKLHFYGTNPDVEPSIRAQRFQAESQFYDNAAEVLTEVERAKFTFCSEYNPWPFVKKFNYATHKSVDNILEHALSLSLS